MSKGQYYPIYRSNFSPWKPSTRPSVGLSTFLGELHFTCDQCGTPTVTRHMRRIEKLRPPYTYYACFACLEIPIPGPPGRTKKSLKND